MGIKELFSDEGLSRSQLLEKASVHRSKGRRKKAITIYRMILRDDPDDHEVHARMAPLLAATGEPGAAIASFRSAAEGFASRGFLDKAIGVYKEATEAVPHDETAWVRLCDLYLARERPKDAVTTLLDGRRGYRRRYDRPRAIRLLSRLLEVEPLHVDGAVDLARLYKASGQRAVARQTLEDLVVRLEGKPRRRVRWALFRLSPTPASLWRWLRGR